MTQHEMPTLDKVVNLFAVVIPFLATIAAIVLETIPGTAGIMVPPKGPGGGANAAS